MNREMKKRGFVAGLRYEKSSVKKWRKGKERKHFKKGGKRREKNKFKRGKRIEWLEIRALPAAWSYREISRVGFHLGRFSISDVYQEINLTCCFTAPLHHSHVLHHTHTVTLSLSLSLGDFETSKNPRIAIATSSSSSSSSSERKVKWWPSCRKAYSFFFRPRFSILQPFRQGVKGTAALLLFALSVSIPFSSCSTILNVY